MTDQAPDRNRYLDLAPFAALFFFAIWASAGREGGSLLIAALALLGCSVLVIVLARRSGTPSCFHWAASGYFGLASLWLALRPATAAWVMTRYAGTGVYLSLLAGALVPLLLGKEPFTRRYARRSAPPDAWGSPMFATITSLMAWVWAGFFGACALLGASASGPARIILPGVLLAGFGLPFTRLFPDWYLRRLGLPPLSEQRRMASRPPARSVSAAPSPGPATARDAISRMPDAFSAREAGDLRAVIGFLVSGRERFEAYLRIEDGTCTMTAEPPRPPDLLIRTPSDVWLAIARGELDGQQALMERAYEVTGNLGVLLRMRHIFVKPGSAS